MFAYKATITNTMCTSRNVCGNKRPIVVNVQNFKLILDFQVNYIR